MSKKQTAVEWLVDELKNELGYGVDLGKSDQRVLDKIIEQANKMFEEQMCQFAFDFNDEFYNNGEVPTPQQYYNETFKKTL